MLIFVNRISIKDTLMKLTRTALLLFFPFYFFSCRTQKALPNYLEKVNDSLDKRSVVIPELRIQKNDNLSIQVYSASLDPKVDELYNPRPVVSSATGQAPTGGF